MSDVKELVDQYAAENLQLKNQAEMLFMLLRDVTMIHQDTKGQIRIPGKVRKQADKFSLQIKQLKTSVVLTVKENTEE